MITFFPIEMDVSFDFKSICKKIQITIDQFKQLPSEIISSMWKNGKYEVKSDVDVDIFKLSLKPIYFKIF